MPPANAKTIQNPDRLNALERLGLLDTEPEASFDRLTSLVCRILNVPIALVTLVDADRQFFKSQVGLSEPYRTLRETPLSHSFCQHIVAGHQPLIIEDARAHPLVHDNPAVSELNMVAYLGIPLLTTDEQVVGSFCAVSTTPRTWTAAEIDIMRDIAASVMTEIELRAEINERQKLQERIEEQEHFIHQIVDTTPAIIFILDLTLQAFLFVNQGAEAIIGYSAHDVHEFPLHQALQWIHDEDRAPLNDETLLDRLRRDGQIELDCRMRRFDGSWCWAHIRTAPFRYDADHNVTQVLGTASDISATKQAEQHTLNLLLEREQVHILHEFMSNTSHELRTPLTIMQTSLYLLRRAEEQERQHERLDHIQQQINRIVQVLDDFNVMMGLDDATHPNRARFNLKWLARLVINRANTRYNAAQRYQLSSYFPDTPAYIYGNAYQIELALMNLVENAFIHAPHGGHIIVTIAPAEGGVILEVTDEGEGIDPEELPHIFRRLYKANKARTTNQSRAGLGLSIVKRVVELHQGSIEVESQPGQGSTFRIFLPDVESQHQPDRSEQIDIHPRNQ